MTKSNELLVTVGICVKNVENTIGEALEGVLGQDFSHEHMEIIIVDGNSQDNTISIIKEYLSKSAINTRFFTENIGLGNARQVVVDNASGKYIVWVDGDIILSPTYISKQVSFMELHPSIGVAVGSFGVIPEDNWVATLENIGYVLDSLRNSGKATSRPIGTEGSISRTKIMKANGFDRNIKGAQEDMDVTCRIKAAGWKFYITDAVLFEKQRRTWKALWKQHFWYGYGLHFVQHKNKGRKLLTDKSVDRIIISSLAYKLTHRKTVFLLPVNFVFKKTALIVGFISAHLDGYGHH
jgi:glycosyltransferase involved in cell wall biosynthesis